MNHCVKSFLDCVHDLEKKSRASKRNLFFDQIVQHWNVSKFNLKLG